MCLGVTVKVPASLSTTRSEGPDGYSDTVTGVGGAIAPIIGGLLAAFSYDWLFLASAILSAAALIVLSVGMREPRRHIQADPLEELNA